MPGSCWNCCQCGGGREEVWYLDPERDEGWWSLWGYTDTVVEGAGGAELRALPCSPPRTPLMASLRNLLVSQGLIRFRGLTSAARVRAHQYFTWRLLTVVKLWIWMTQQARPQLFRAPWQQPRATEQVKKRPEVAFNLLLGSFNPLLSFSWEKQQTATPVETARLHFSGQIWEGKRDF